MSEPQTTDQRLGQLEAEVFKLNRAVQVLMTEQAKLIQRQAEIANHITALLKMGPAKKGALTEAVNGTLHR